jgi:hypothetical protein
MANSNPPAKADEKTHGKLYELASEFLGTLFGKGDKPGLFLREPLPGGYGSRMEFMRSTLSTPGNQEHLAKMPQPHTCYLATVMAARGNPWYPPDLVVAFTTAFTPRRPQEGNEEDYDDTASRVERLTLLAEIAALTRDPATGKSRVALKLPFGHLDFPGAVIGIFEALTKEEKEKLDLNSLEEGGFREFSSDLDDVVAELEPRTLTPMQRFYLRAQQWDEQREAARRERDERRRGLRGSHGDDATDALPQALPAAPKPEPAPPAEPAIPDLSTLFGGGSTQPPATPPRVNRGRRGATAPTVPTIAPPPLPTLPAEGPKPAATAPSESAALATILDGGSAKAKAFALYLRQGKVTLEKAETIARTEGLF